MSSSDDAPLSKSNSIGRGILRRSLTLNKNLDSPFVTIVRGASEDVSSVVANLYNPQVVVNNVDPSPLLSAGQNDNATSVDAALSWAYNVSWIVNVLLFVAKFVAYWMSGSKSVLASLADSVVDLVSQVVIFMAEYRSKKMDPRYPVGQARLETLGVLACACLMSICAYEVISDGVVTLYDGIENGERPFLDTSVTMYAVLASATLLKAICYFICVKLKNRSDSMAALAEDHLNDIMSNLGATVTVAVAGYWDQLWWSDPAGAIIISLYIVWRWMDVAGNQVDKIVGRGAPDELLEELKTIAHTHDFRLTVDVIRAYHFGARFMVEMEVVMPEDLRLREVHDVSIGLLNKVEALEQVERAFVHVDYSKREQPEHRADRVLMGLPAVLE